MRRQLAIRQAIATVLALFAVLAVVAHCTGCLSAAEKYQAALLRCVDQAKTLEESRDCRHVVDGEYGITQTVRKDAGADR